MTYKCINKYIVDDTTIMVPGDIIAVYENRLYNTNTTFDYYFYNIDDIKPYIEPIENESDTELFKNITVKMCDIFERKNHDYGNSFEQSLDEEGLAASRIRMGDKWNRFKSLSKGKKAQINDESLRDTLLDMANYAIMTIMWLDKHGNV